ncbi:acetyltransferase [Desulfurivibrio sp. D14AmB]|uniref:acetyltransferase n=1 Tax=Desulfurivibrio sp. D14AmB TaxID=3374370 RepID=UPI00376F3030
MHYFDIFNGDADGICALRQLRLARPRPEAELITGVKRDNALLAQLAGRSELAASVLTVLDISLDRNREALLALPAGCRVFYVDHHYAGAIPTAEGREFHIEPNPELCTSLIVDRLLEGRFRPWAVVGAFGDNLHGPARRAAAPLALAESDLQALREVGELLNYNGYGARLADLHFHPAELYRAVGEFADPLEFHRHSAQLRALREGFARDLEQARRLPPLEEGPAGRVFRLPDQPWARRVAGVFANELARARPAQAHALLVEQGGEGLLVSVRAPLERPAGADDLCRRFPSGGGRAAAAGINALPLELLPAFLAAFAATFAPPSP